MPATDYQGSSSPFASLGRSILTTRRDPAIDPQVGGGVPSMDSHELVSFQRQVADLFQALAADTDDVLSINWIRKLLDSFLICHEQFRLIVFDGTLKEAPFRPPLDRMIAEYFERTVKALDVCNAIRDGIDHVRNWGKHLEIVMIALNPNQKTLGEGQFRRAKKALTDLTIAMLDEKDSGAASVLAARNRSFGRNNNNNSAAKDKHFRSLSWSVSRNWSAARQLQAIGNNLSAPRSNEIIATNGLAVPVFTMNSIVLFVMWALVAAIPCQDRGLQTHFSIPRGFAWASPVLALHEQVMEESKKRDRRNSSGLLKEIHRIEKCSRHLSELVDSVQFPLSEEREMEIREEMQELSKVCEAMKNGLEPLERQVREVFRRIVRSRTEGLDCLGQSTHS